MQGAQDGGLAQEVQVQDMQQAAGSSELPPMLSHPTTAPAARPTVGATITTEAPTIAGGSTTAAAAAASQARGAVDGLLAQALSVPSSAGIPAATSPGLLHGLQVALPAGAVPHAAAGLNPAVLLAALQQQQQAVLQQQQAGRTASTASAGAPAAAAAAGNPALAGAAASIAASGPGFLQQLKAAGAAGNPVAQQAIDLMSRMPQNAVAQVLLGLTPNAAPAKPPFSLMAVLGDMSGPVSLQQAVSIQKAVRCLKDAQLANSLIALAAMVPADLQAMLNSNSINLKDVVGKLQQHLDPIRAREQFGDTYSYDTSASAQQQMAAALVAQQQMARQLQQAPGAEAAHQAVMQQLLLGQQAVAAAAQGKLPVLLAQQMALMPPAAQQQLLQQQVALALVQAQQQGSARGPSAAAAGTRPAAPGLKPALSAAGPAASATASAASMPGAARESSPLEAPQQTLARLQPGSLKHAIFELLLTAGPQGMVLHDMIAALQAKGIGSWPDMRSARTSLTSTCSHEPAIIRIAPSRFAARVLVPGGGPAGIAASMAAADAAKAAQSREDAETQDRDGESGAEEAEVQEAPGSPHDVADDRQLSVCGQLPIQPQPGFHANDTMCAVCKKAVHLAMSPLLLCDFCPCAVHVACLGLGPHLTLGLPMWAHTLPGGPADFSMLPEGQFACPRCLQRSGLKAPDPPGMANLPLMGMPAHARPQIPGAAGAGSAARPPLSGPMTGRAATSAEGWESGTGSKPVRFLDRAERQALAEKERQEKAARREEKARQKEAARAAKVQEREERTKAREECRNVPIPVAPAAQAAGAAPAQAAGAAAPAATPSRPVVSRVPVIKDDLDLQAEEQAELARLQAEYSNGMASKGHAAARPGYPTSHQLHHGQVITTSAAGPSTVALAASGQLSSVASAGRLPSASSLSGLYHHAGVSHAGMSHPQGLAAQLQQRALVVEGPRVLEHPTITGTAAVATALEALAIAEFSCMFSNLMTGIMPMSCVEVQHAVVWPLQAGIRLPALYCGLLRVLLASWQVMAAGGPLVARIKRWMRLLTRAKGDAGAWQDLVRRYLLLSRAGLSVSPSDLHPETWAELSDDLAAVHAGVEFGRVPYWKLAPELHLRCLTCLAGDVVQCEFIKDALSKRIDLAGEIQNAKLHADAEARRRERGVGKNKRMAVKGGVAFVPQPAVPAAAPPAEQAFAAGRGQAAGRGKVAARGRGRGRGSQLQGATSMDLDAQAGSVSTPGLEDETEGGGNEGAVGAENGLAASAPKPQQQPAMQTPALANGMAGDEKGQGGKSKTGDAEEEQGGDGAVAGGLKRKHSEMGGDNEEGGEDSVDHAAEWAQREEAFERDMRSVAVRTEPFGMDRHYNRYWWLPHGGPGGGLRAGTVVVESSNSDAAATLDTPTQLADLLARLNKRGAREGPLHAALLKLADRIKDGMHQRATQPDLYPNPLRPLTADTVQHAPPARIAEAMVVEEAAARVPGVNVGRGRKKAVTVASLLREASLTPQAPSPRESTPGLDDIPAKPVAVKSEDITAQSQLGLKNTESEQIKQEQDGQQVAVKDEGMMAVDAADGASTKQEVEGGVKDEPKTTDQVAAAAETAGQKTIVQHVSNELMAMGERLAQLGAVQIDTQTWGNRLRSATDAAGLCTALLQCEADLCPLFDGLPEGADDATLEPLVAEVEVYAAEFVLPAEPGTEAAQPAGGASSDMVVKDGANSEPTNETSQPGGGSSEGGEGAGVEEVVGDGVQGEENGAPGGGGVKSDTPAAVSLEAGGGAARSLRGQGTGMLAVHMPSTTHMCSSSQPASDARKPQGHIVLHPTPQLDGQAAQVLDGSSMAKNADQGVVVAGTQQTPQPSKQLQTGPVPMQIDGSPQAQQETGTQQGAVPPLQQQGVAQNTDAADSLAVQSAAESQVPQVQLVAAIEEIDDYDPEREIDRERAFERALQQHAAQHASAVASAAAAGEPVPEFTPLQRPFFALWRGARERCTFLRDVRRASLTVNISAAAYCVLFLADRCNMLLRRMMKEKGGDKEKAAVERAAAAAAEAERAAAERRKEEEAAVAGPRRRKLSQHASEAEAAGIRIPGAHTPAGHWASLHQTQKKGRGKARGKARGTARGAAAAYAAQQIAEQVAAAAEQGIWLCTACGDEGELLMCEVEGCPNLMHPRCAGLDGVPEGEWYCPQHAQSLGIQPSASLEEEDSVAPSTQAKGRSARGKTAAQGGAAGRSRSRGGRASRVSNGGDEDSGETTVSDEDVEARAGRAATAGTRRAAARQAVAAAVAAEAADDEKTETDSATETD